MADQAIADRVTYRFIDARDNVPTCNVVVESPRVARLNPLDADYDVRLQDLAWEIDSDTVMQARRELSALADASTLSSGCSIHFTGHA